MSYYVHQLPAGKWHLLAWDWKEQNLLCMANKQSFLFRKELDSITTESSSATVAQRDKVPQQNLK